MSERELSSYAFSQHGDDARLYNGIHDLETELSTLRSKLEAAENARDSLAVRLADWVEAFDSFVPFEAKRDAYALCDELAAALRELKHQVPAVLHSPANAALAKYDAQSAKEGL